MEKSDAKKKNNILHCDHCYYYGDEDHKDVEFTISTHSCLVHPLILLEVAMIIFPHGVLGLLFRHVDNYAASRRG